MNYKECSLTTSDGTLFAGNIWSPDKAQTVILLIHGWGEHAMRYDHWAKRFNEKNYAFVAYDLRGHGKSGGKRGHVPNYETFMTDISTMIVEVKKTFPSIPVILYGHSMGGNLVLNYAVRQKPDIKAVIATSPWLKLATEPPKILLATGKFINNFYPAFTLSSDLDASGISHDPVEVKKYKTDPLNHNKISVRLVDEIYKSGEWVTSQGEKLQLPVLVMHGSGDKITDHKKSIEFVEKSKGKVSIKIWNDLYHEMHNEPERTDVFNYLINWLDSI